MLSLNGTPADGTLIQMRGYPLGDLFGTDYTK